MQNSNELWEIPAPFRNPLFYPDKNSFQQQDISVISQVISHEPFYFDMLYALKETLECNPWENPKDFVSIILAEWKQLKGNAREIYKQKERSNKSERLLVHCVSLFIACLFWLNRSPVLGLRPSDMELDDFYRKPVNCKERLLFIMSKPTQYHAFIQLEQLFNECEKIYAKAIALKQI
ncbi:YpoC family protein [Metabacillus halosaccharovorans]|uniref:YpoC-like domain-containing protein n=1 Tax=Metabacillus halosaccharovorans TaxID=930124 RepID=A0ABT3DMU5_9BACI|nr:hypothetical protein [Metabacillus halosaccharovorans]MCV9888386.1 hypothetical protein [Metabacillus halosaccharovorans]